MYKFTTLAVLSIGVAQLGSAGMILSTSAFVSGTGLGTEPTILTIQNSPTEIGCVGASAASIGSTFSVSGVCVGSSADVKTGAGQIGPQSVAGITGADNFGIVFNADQLAGGPITLTDLVASFYTSGGVFLYKTSGLSCAAAGVPGCAFTNTASGVGKSGYLFVFDTAQASAATAAGVFLSGTNIVGLSASTSGANGGPESFYLANLGGAGGGGGGGAVPEPASLVLSLGGLGLLGIGAIRKRLAAAKV